MYYNLDWEIKFKNNSKTYNLLMIVECEIEENVENLSDIATIMLPETMLNQALQVKDKIGRGTEVTIKFGYNGQLKTEFVGFVRDITTDGSLKILCEDALFLFRKKIPDWAVQPPKKKAKKKKDDDTGTTPPEPEKPKVLTSVKKIAEYVCKHIDPSYKVVCDFDIMYEKFIIHQATGYDVLQKLQEETKANIYFNTEKKELHIRAPFTEKGGYVIYCMQKNIEKSSLEYKKALDRKFELTVESIQKDGTVKTERIGTPGGDSKTIRVGSLDAKSLKVRAHNEFEQYARDTYEGTFDTWLIPFCKPTYSAKIVDFDYPEQRGIYYVKAVTTKISAEGGVRTITPALKTASA
ncbi:hypothetical protein [Chryseobacterium cucumeris]|uniref:hypothetical protein n=1 Tax=Chryseobacterium cucumeris TaxID=1813611 RepID=UPI0037C132D5